jgi:cytochrome c oxidase assembly factor CtaG
MVTATATETEQPRAGWRFRLGLIVLVVGWLGPYGANMIPGYETHRFVVSLIGDVMFVASLFVLGGDFWDKVRAGFVYDARVQISGSKPDLGTHS